MAQFSRRCTTRAAAFSGVNISLITAAQAEALAAAAAHAGGVAATAAYLVERLDQGNPYFLITFGEPGSAGAIVAVDARTGVIMSSAKVEQLEGPWLLEKAQAVEYAGCIDLVAARLVWGPSRATRSLFYPLWELACESGRIYVDRDGKVWHELLPAGPG